MKTIWILGAAMLAGVVAGTVALAPATPSASAADDMTYSVRIENLTGGQTFTPPLLAVHAADMHVFEAGEEASAELQQIAENGNLDPMVALLEGSPGVTSVVVADGPLMPGQSVTLMVEAPAGSVLSWVSMLICTNDGFTGIDAFALTGGETLQTNGYDAGTEQNTEDFADLVPPCQPLSGVSSSKAGTGMSNSALAEGGVIVHHPGVEGGADLTSKHMWTDPVARVTISEVVISPPSTGTGGLVADGGTGWQLYAAALLAVASLAAGLTLATRRA